METKTQRIIRLSKELFGIIKKDDWNLYSSNNEISIMSFNLRGDKETDKKHHWLDRRNSIIEMIKDKQPDIICCQESWTSINKFFKAKIGCNYNSYAIDTFCGTRFDIVPIMNIGNSIFYNKHKYELIEKNVFWLSDNTSKIPTNTWNNSEPRNCIYVKLKNKETNKLYTIFNTHFDHQNIEARNKSTNLLIKYVNKYSKESEVYFCGDFNATISNNELSEFNSFNYYPKLNMVNTTFNGYSNNRKLVIDYILTNNDGFYNFEQIIDGYGVKYLSDHYPMMIYK